ncbi:MAG: tRNA-dihydrouridine synthase [Kiritimatiellae bacterium]|nr:tRNA-dihydrouridine synthase [Kiritimatiellia bacterium]
MTFSLAPLAGFTDAPFRRLCAEGGADMAYTEMVSAAGLSHGSSPTRHLMERMDGEGPVACQIFGAKETDVAFAARVVPGGFCQLNLNAGCPMAKVTREGAGAKLMEDPAKIYRLVKAMAENTALPVTVKTRIGPRPGWLNAMEILDAVQSAGAKGIVVHARYTSQMHGGEVHLDVLEDIVRHAEIPVVGNGGVRDRKTAKEMEKTGVAGIMVGRAALANPSVFRLLKGEDASVDPVEACRTHLEYILGFRLLLERKYPLDHIPGEDGFASVKMHTHLFRYFSGRPGAAALRARLNQVRTLGEIREILCALASRNMV